MKTQVLSCRLGDLDLHAKLQREYAKIQRDVAELRAEQAQLQRQMEKIFGDADMNHREQQAAHVSKKRRVENSTQQETSVELEHLLRLMKSLVNKRIKLIVWKEELRKDLHKVYQSLCKLCLSSGPPEVNSVANRFDPTIGGGEMLEIVGCMRSLSNLYYHVRFATAHTLHHDCLWRSADWMNEHAPELVFDFHASFPQEHHARVLTHSGMAIGGVERGR